MIKLGREKGSCVVMFGFENMQPAIRALHLLPYPAHINPLSATLTRERIKIVDAAIKKAMR